MYPIERITEFIEQIRVANITTINNCFINTKLHIWIDWDKHFVFSYYEYRTILKTDKMLCNKKVYDLIHKSFHEHFSFSKVPSHLNEMIINKTNDITEKLIHQCDHFIKKEIVENFNKAVADCILLGDESEDLINMINENVIKLVHEK